MKERKEGKEERDKKKRAPKWALRLCVLDILFLPFLPPSIPFCGMDLPSRRSIVSIRNIAIDNWEQVSALTVNRNQEKVAPANLHSLCEHQFHSPHSIVRAVYADNNPVGFIRLQSFSPSSHASECPDDSKADEKGCYLLLNFMIDWKSQGLGFGTRALKALQQDMVAEHECRSIHILVATFSTLHKDDSPAEFFESLGFVMDSVAGRLVWTP